MSISDLQNLYNRDGTVPSAGSGSTIITYQTNYIQKLQDLVNAINYANTNNCFKNNPSLQDLTSNLPNKIQNCAQQKINDISNAIKALDDAKITFSSAFVVTQKPNSNYDDIIANNKKIQDLRNELDLKLKDLNHTPDSRFQTYEDNYNYELMMNITWSILATSIIYYVFAKL